MKNVFLRLLLFSFFFYWYPGKESYMNRRATENFISLPYTSGSGYFVFRSPWDILNWVFVLFFLKYIEEKHLRYHVLHICYSICCSCADMSYYQYMNGISISTNNSSLIIAKWRLYSFVPRGVCIFEKHGYPTSPCERKTVLTRRGSHLQYIL